MSLPFTLISLTRYRPLSPGGFLVRMAVCLLVMLAAVATGGDAQEPEGTRLAVSDTLWEVHLTGGESYVGRVVVVEVDTISLSTVTGTRIRFPRGQVARVRPAQGRIRDGVYWPPDPNTTRLFFSPTGRTLPQDGAYAGVYELFVPFIAYGITDALMIAGGSPFYLALGGQTPPVYLGPKLRVFASERLATSVGALALVVPDASDSFHLGILYGAATWGDADASVSGGLGWGYVEDQVADRPLAMLGGEYRVSRRVKLLTENLFVPGETGVIASGGIRIFGERLAADAGIVTLLAIMTMTCCSPSGMAVRSGGRSSTP